MYWCPYGERRTSTKCEECKCTVASWFFGINSNISASNKITSPCLVTFMWPHHTSIAMTRDLPGYTELQSAQCGHRYICLGTTRQHYTYFKNIYSVRSTFTVSVTADVFEMEIQQLTVSAQCRAPYWSILLIVPGYGTKLAPMHLGLADRPFVPLVKSWEPCCFAEAPDGPQVSALNILWLQGKGAQMHVSEWGQGLTFTENVGRGFLFHSTLPTQRTVCQP
jgi:hypothetical protein